MSEDWRKAISFSDRLGETTKMQVSARTRNTSVAWILTMCSVAAYKAVHHGCQPAEASKYAKASEEKARKDALSLVCTPHFGME